jgi:hypothetical protein
LIVAVSGTGDMELERNCWNLEDNLLGGILYTPVR